MTKAFTPLSPRMKKPQMVAWLSILAMPFPILASVIVILVSPDDLPSYLQVETSAPSCELQSMAPDVNLVWHATVKALAADMEDSKAAWSIANKGEGAHISLLNDGGVVDRKNGQAMREGDYWIWKISFMPEVLDLLRFRWRAEGLWWELHLAGFFEGERCLEESGTKSGRGAESVD